MRRNLACCQFPSRLERRHCLKHLALLLSVGVLIDPAASALARERLLFYLRVIGGKVVDPRGPIRVLQGDKVELNWTSDEAMFVHLHGYDIELKVPRGNAATMFFTADFTGRFAITSHPLGDHGGSENTLTYLEVLPR